MNGNKNVLPTLFPQAYGSFDNGAGASVPHIECSVGVIKSMVNGFKVVLGEAIPAEHGLKTLFVVNIHCFHRIKITELELK